MIGAEDKLKEAYASALRDYVAHGNEDALQHAFEFGRQAMTEGLGLLDVVTIHHESLQALLRQLSHEEDGRVVQESAEFFMQIVSPFEMTHRGFQDANESLRQLNETLEQRVEERTAELQERSEELSRSNAELQQFAYVASHDLQEPLRMITSYTQLLARRYGDRLDAEAKEFINYAVDGANRMQTLINDLLKYSRLDSRGREFGPADCAAACRAARANLKVAIEEKRADVSAGDLPVVYGDEVQLAQLFQNLIGNALKYSRPEEPPEISIEAQRTGDEWVFSVADNGIGIEQQYLDRIFQVFKRLHGRETYSGTGIGLAICKRIVERHGGRMWVESEPGTGSKFYFAIPYREDVGTEEAHGE